MASSVADYAKGKAKKVATQFLTKLIDSFDSDEKDQTSTSGGNHGAVQSYSPSPVNQQAPVPPSSGQYNLASSFNSMSISNTQPPQVPPGPPPPGFIGGFNPQYLGDTPGPYSSQSAAYAHATPVPYSGSTSTPAIPNPYTNPQSNIMQLALQSDQPQAPWKSDTAISSTSKPPPKKTKKKKDDDDDDDDELDTTTPSTCKPPPRKTPKKKKKDDDDDDDYEEVDDDEDETYLSPSKSSKPRPSASSTPSTPRPKLSRPSSSKSPGSKGRQVQCAGVTKAGKKCTRMVKVDGDSGDESESDGNKFCHQHSKEVLNGNTGFYARKNGEWVKFDDWIPRYLQPEAQVALRCEMERTRSQSDVPGYIYTFEIRDETSKNTIKLKVGRAVNLVKRIDQWGKQCGSKEQVLRGFYPGTVDPDEDGGPATLMKGRVLAGEKGPWCHRLERLIHIELGDLVRTSIYLDSKWPKTEFEEWEERNPDSVKTAPIHGPCSDCGSMHKEIFEFERWTSGKNKGKEWDTLVRGVIERWGKFVELYL